MGMTWLSGVLPLDAGYHPRHRSTRRDDLDIDRLEESWHEPLPEHETRVVPELVQLIAHSSHTPATITRAWSEFEEATRDVYALHLRIRNWSALFSRDELGACPHEDAAESVLSYADYAWRLITRGPMGARSPAAVEATATRTR